MNLTSYFNDNKADEKIKFTQSIDFWSKSVTANVRLTVIE